MTTTTTTTQQQQQQQLGLFIGIVLEQGFACQLNTQDDGKTRLRTSLTVWQVYVDGRQSCALPVVDHVCHCSYSDILDNVHAKGVESTAEVFQPMNTDYAAVIDADITCRGSAL